MEFKMEFKDVDDFIRRLSALNDNIEATKKLTDFYATARLKIDSSLFDRQYTDGSDDGGIDFYHVQDSTFIIFQTKFSVSSRKVNSSEILKEIGKLKNTLTGVNPNRKAEDFVSQLKKEVNNKNANLEIVWLTTNIVDQSVKEEVQKDINEWRKANGWQINVDFVVVDRYSLENVIYDVRHGYIPYTGKKTLKLEPGQWMETRWVETNVYSIVCSVCVNELLRWFNTSEEINQFLQKNVREFLGETGKVGKINKAIGQSYLSDPDWFWYKHNGIIILADDVFIDKEKNELVLRNPQIINGGQTLKALFSAYIKNNRPENSAKVLLRIYRLPYEDAETYKRSIEIISALNSQNKINPSDLKSTDPRQVRLERLFQKIGSGYRYWRKRSKEAKSSRYSITMRNLALRYYVCKRNVPHEGVRGNVEELFEEDTKYNEIFDEGSINRDLSANHIAITYVTIWNIDQILSHVELPQIDSEYFQYTRWFVLVDVYRKLMEWKKRKFELGWKSWVDFVESYEFEKAVNDYSKYAFKECRKIRPVNEEPRSFFRTKEATKKFLSKTSSQKFDAYMNQAYKKFKNKIEK